MAGKMAISVVGAGLMGAGIALVFAAAGHDVALYDAKAAAREAALPRIRDLLKALGLDEAIAGAIRLHDDLAACVARANFVFEAAPEDLALKQALFVEIEAAARPEAILASNTSVIPITAIMSGLRDKSRALGTHWWNPPYLVPLVEVIRTSSTSDQALAAMMALLTEAGKTAVEVKRDVPGFIGNRLQHALWREAIALVAEGVCDAKTVDDVVKSSFGARLAVLGPLENADLVGLELTRAIHGYLLPALDRATEPSSVLDRLIGEGRLGFISGAGFQAWTPEQQAHVRDKVMQHLKASFGAPRVLRESTHGQNQI
ncbi:MAG: 3-hydroxyacyl-CoA dehydrogenase family protein [Hyphomicrobiales bacterium]|nr:3-hydroxyacyl-CoA dehydrogenase family protein [Hyphomicrobiales bacterium]